MPDNFGDIVTYTLANGVTRPAVVISQSWSKEEGETLDLEVFGVPPDLPERFPKAVKFQSGDDPQPGTWSF